MRAVVRFAYPVVLTLAACWLVFEMDGRPTRGVDDAQILFSYSSNLAAGKGLVYANNPEHVEGATSLLWTFVCAIPFRLGLNEIGVLAISVFLLCLTQLFAVEMVRRLAATRKVPSLPFEFAYLLAVFSSPTYATWMSITLMDTCLWGFLVVLMTSVATFPPRSRLGTALGSLPFFFAPLSRPEAALVAPAIIALAWLRGDSRGGQGRLVFSLTAAFLASAVAVTIFRLSYFGYPLPNTYYAKVSPSLAYNLADGVTYLGGFVFNSGPLVVTAVCFLLWCAGNLFGRSVRLLRNRESMRQRGGVAPWRLVALCAMVLLVVPVLTGGDHFLGYRFYQPAYPVTVLAVVLFLVSRLPTPSLGWLTPSGLARHRLAAAVVLGGLAYWAYSGAYKPSWMDADMSQHKVIKDQFEAAEAGMQEGGSLRRLFAGLGEYPVLGVTAAGGIARTYPGRIVDLMGLNTPSIAHRPGARRGFKNHAAFERDVFFEVGRIDLLLASPPIPPARSTGVSRALKGLLDDPRFTSQWRYGVLRPSGDTAVGFAAFFSAQFLESLARTDRYRFTETMRWCAMWIPVEDTCGCAE